MSPLTIRIFLGLQTTSNKIYCKRSLSQVFKTWKRICDYIELQRLIEEVSEDISKSKEQHYDCLSKKLNNPKSSLKTL